jgi:hypothetical protein
LSTKSDINIICIYGLWLVYCNFLFLQLPYDIYFMSYIVGLNKYKISSNLKPNMRYVIFELSEKKYMLFLVHSSTSLLFHIFYTHFKNIQKKKLQQIYFWWPKIISHPTLTSCVCVYIYIYIHTHTKLVFIYCIVLLYSRINFWRTLFTSFFVSLNNTPHQSPSPSTLCTDAPLSP